MIFSVITASHDFESIKETCDSLTNQSLDFKENIEVLIFGIENEIQILSDLANQYPANFKIIDDLDLSEIAKNASGTYITFLDEKSEFSRNAFKDVLAFFEKNPDADLVSIPTYFSKKRTDEPKFRENKTANLLENPEYYLLPDEACFIKKDAVKSNAYVNEILIDNPNIGLCRQAKCYSHRSDGLSVEENERYIKKLTHKCLEKYSNVPEFIQNTIMPDLKAILNDEKIKDKLNSTEIENLKSSLAEVLQYIDDDLILSQKDDDLKIKCFLLKWGKIPDELISNTVYIDIYEIIDDKLYILANISNMDKRKIDVYVNNQKIAVNEISFHQRDRYCLDCRYSTDYSMDFSIPLNQNESFEIEFKSNGKALEIDFSRPCNFSKIVGYAKSRHYLSTLKENRIIVEKKTTAKWIKQELKSLIGMIKNREPGFKVGIPFRIAYMLGYPFLKNKRIWFFMDRPNAADDNGMHLYQYALDKDSDIKKYFIIKKGTPDYEEMKKTGNVLGYKSIKHRYLGMFAENIITSHPDNQFIYPFWGTYPHFAGLLKSSTMFLQHGIIKDDISSWLSRFDMNLSFFLTSAKMEYESIFKYDYNYDKSVVQLLGLPRYDGLENAEDKKQIIIMPSWRRDLTGKSNEYVKKSEYFRHFNSLINNEKLIRKARENNYEIIFRPHPNVYYYIDLFGENDYVKIDRDKIKYQTLFNNGSLLITDYSSVAFDFAYLYKPVLYYQYGSDYHFDAENSFFDYEEMGFGEISKREDELVDLIIEYIENDCEIKEKYSKRIDAFYEFRDRNNCMRVYDKIRSIKPKD